MNYIIITYCAYLVISIGLTLWVGSTLFKNGRIFLVDTFAGNNALADSVNHLLLVGFYLVNFGFVALFLKHAERPLDLAEALEVLSYREGVVLLVLGGMHFMNLYIFNRMRKRALMWNAPPPVTPDGKVELP